MVKWIFFDVGSMLGDETEAYAHQVRDMLSGTSITVEQFEAMCLAFAQAGLDVHSAAIKHLGLVKTPWHSEDEVPYAEAYSTLPVLCDRGYHLGIIADQKCGTAQRLAAGGVHTLMSSPPSQKSARPSQAKRFLKRPLNWPGAAQRIA